MYKIFTLAALMITSNAFAISSILPINTEALVRSKLWNQGVQVTENSGYESESVELIEEIYVPLESFDI